MYHSTPGLPVHHQLPEFTQTHVHQVSDVTQPSHPLSSPSPPAPNPSQHQSLFQWVNSSHEVAMQMDPKSGAGWQVGRESAPLVYGSWLPAPFPFPPYCLGVFSDLSARSFPFCLPQASLVAQMVKSLPAVWETQVRSLGWKIPWRRKWQPTPGFLPEEFYGWRSLVGYSPWGHEESDTTERLHFTSLLPTRLLSGLVHCCWWAAKAVTMGVGSLGMKLGRKFLTRTVGCVISDRVANPASVTDSEI